MVLRSISAAAWKIYGAGWTTCWSELDHFEAQPPEVKRRILGEKLLGQIRYFSSRPDALPEWREAAKARTVDDLWRLWTSLPIVTKDTLRTIFRPERILRECGIKGRMDSTGGSTGEPTRFVHDSRMIRAKRALHLYTRLRMGWVPGMPTIILWGSDRDIGRKVPITSRLWRWIAGDFVLGGFAMTDATVVRLHRLIQRNKPVAIYGYSSLLEWVARRSIALGLYSSPGAVKVAWNGGEVLTPSQIEVFKKVFGVPILNRYGGRELGVMACQYRPSEPLWILRPWLFAEVLNREGKPAGPGEAGRVVWTSAICRGTPFIRYDIGDLGQFDASHQDESGVFALTSVVGRTSGLAYIRDNRVLSAIFWDHLFKEYPTISQFQVRVSPGQILVLLQGSGFEPSQEAALVRTIKCMLPGYSIRLQWVQHIPTGPQGKLLHVVNEWIPGLNSN